MALHFVLLLILLIGATAGCTDDCSGLRCGCVEGSAVYVQLPNAPDGTTVTADTLVCTDSGPGSSDCTSRTMPYPQRAMISAPGYESVEVSLTRVPTGGDGCCPCEGTEGWQALVTLVAETALDSGSDG